MHIPRIHLGKYYWGIAASLIGLLTGIWLIIAPFALGYQAYGADWVDQTKNNFFVGIAVVIVALISTLLFVRSLMSELHAVGLVRPQPRPEAVEAAQMAAMPSAPAVSPAQADLDRTIANLAAVLAADLAERRQNDNGRTPAVSNDLRREA